MDFLDKPARSFMTGQFVVIDEETDVASAVKEMQQQRAESIIVSRRGLAIGILTDDDIIDKAGNHLDGESNASEPQEFPTFPSGVVQIEFPLLIESAWINSLSIPLLLNR